MKEQSNYMNKGFLYNESFYFSSKKDAGVIFTCKLEGDTFSEDIRFSLCGCDVCSHTAATYLQISVS